MLTPPPSDLNWLFFDLNSFFASVEQQENPAYRNKPLAVVPMLTDSTCAIAASYAAKAYGIKTGTKIYDAKRMCPHLICKLAEHDLYVRYHHRIFDEVANHIPVTRICSIDEAACELLGEEKRPETARKIACSIKDGVKKNIGEYITCSIGIAPNAFLAKVASDMQKPDGLVILDQHNLKERLFALKLRDLPGINIRMEQRLNRANVYTIEEFWNLSPKHARKIWHSVEGERFWYKLHGYHIPERETQKRVVGHSRILDPALRSPDSAYAVTRQLLIKATTRLRRYDLYAKNLYLSTRTVSGLRWANDLSLAPTQDHQDFLKALDRLWEHMIRTIHNERIKKVSITLFDLQKPSDITLDLFDNANAKQDIRTIQGNPLLFESIEKLNKRYGAHTVNIGMMPKTSAGYVGTKIAFTHIPEQDEFHE